MNVAVVIPSKTDMNLRACAAHVRRQEPSRRVIVVDDGLSDYPKDVCVLQGGKPFCFAANCNLGVATALENPSCGGVILLNDDALLKTPNGFSVLVQEWAHHPECGVVSATCNRIGNPNQKPWQLPKFRYESTVLAFVCVFIPRSTFEQVGLLDERFTAYGCEDNDYCRRVLNAGMKLGITEGCTVDHQSLPSSFRSDKNKPRLLLEGRRIFQEKWGDMFVALAGMGALCA